MKKLEKKKPFGTVHGVGRAKFEQGGVLFDANGQQILTAEEEAELEKSESETKAPVKQGARGKQKQASAEEEAPTTEVDDQLAAQTDLDGAAK